MGGSDVPSPAQKLQNQSANKLPVHKILKIPKTQQGPLARELAQNVTGKTRSL